MTNVGWFWKSIWVALIFSPCLLTIGVIKKNYNLPAETTMALYLIGTGIGMIVWMHKQTGTINFAHQEQIWSGVIILLVGFLLGALGNILFAQVLSDNTVNAGLPVAVANSSAAIVFILAVSLYYLFPNFFCEAKFSWNALIGIVIVLFGLFVMNYKK
jgi:hypothetical protein